MLGSFIHSSDAIYTGRHAFRCVLRRVWILFFCLRRIYVRCARFSVVVMRRAGFFNCFQGAVYLYFCCGYGRELEFFVRLFDNLIVGKGFAQGALFLLCLV